MRHLLGQFQRLTLRSSLKNTSKYFHSGQCLRNDGSLFSDVGTQPNSAPVSSSPSLPAKEKGVSRSEQMLKDPEVQDIIGRPESAASKLLSPFKRQLYEAAISSGGYKKDKLIELDGQKYKLSLSKEELEALEPSVYLKSYRIKGSVKKATPFLRMLRGMPLKKAITQCHFTSKRMGRDVGEMLSRGLDDAKALKMDENDLYIAQLWVGKDPFQIKRIDYKGRGRMGIITHKWIHVRAVLKTSVTKDRIKADANARREKKKVSEQLHSTPFHDKKSSVYNW